MVLQTRLSRLHAALNQPATNNIGMGQMSESEESCDHVAPLGYVESCDKDSTDFNLVLDSSIFPSEDRISQDDFGDFLQEFFGQGFGQ